jgi:predicted dehydrogenase
MLKIGILGAARIAPQSIIRPAARRGDVIIAAVASRSATGARTCAEAHAIPTSYGDYPSLLADPDVELVYNALPPSSHAEWSIHALEAGKDVLCEKPFAMSAAEATRMTHAAAANGRRLIEAFHDRYHPVGMLVSQLRSTGRIGEIVHMQARFAATIPYDPESIRHDPAVGGGALMDLGCYAVHWVRTLMGEEPRVATASAVRNPLGADDSIDASLEFPSGATAFVSASMTPGLPTASSLEVIGTVGTVSIDNLVFAHRGHSIRETVGDITRTSTLAGDETYDHQLAAVVTALSSGDPLPTEGADPIGNMAVIDAIYRAARFERSYD